MLLVSSEILTCVGGVGGRAGDLPLLLLLSMLLLLPLLLLPSPSYGGVSGLLLSEGAGSAFYGWNRRFVGFGAGKVEKSTDLLS